MKPMVYIAGPYTTPCPVQNTRAAALAGQRLYDSGYAVPLVPHLSLISDLVRPRPVEYWYAYDLELLERCSAVLRLPGESAGADAEVRRARTLGLPVFDDEGLCIAWAKRWHGDARAKGLGL